MKALIVALALAFAAPAHAPQKPAAGKPHLLVYKSPTCGCCAKWVDYMQAHGFSAAVTNMPDVTPVKIAHKLPPRLASCHTTLIDGYVIEGHVPVEDVRRLLKEKPANVAGLAAPGMPAGSPGMDVPNSPPYEVLLVRNDGTTTRFARHTPQ